MPKIREVKEIPIKALVVGKGQARVRDIGRGIEELAQSIRVIGLLEPIMVCPGEKEGTYEVLLGQRRVHAHELLQRDTILAAVIPERVDEATAKVISVTENLVREDLNEKDVIDACTILYRKYGTLRAVSEETGLSYEKVRKFVQFDQLVPALKELVNNGDVRLDVALKAQGAASVTGECNVEEAVKFAKEMMPMSGAQRGKLVKDRQDDPDAAADELIERAKTGAKVTQVVVTVSAETHRSLQKMAREKDTPIGEAARELIEEGLAGHGYTEK